ncbi:hypothetical protein HWV00_20910 (plasmid) [Moritella sp. 24]|uniref:hypothetical protein n=1 Tax=Moritella sp. 24 TaxID=2746230 RepID=UPI001BAA7E12|nr:hypothetical protein [Moritella sp. 24]QUM78735.1 hypothetical protein HWV00_20910 [Moritella sp. 24]
MVMNDGTEKPKKLGAIGSVLKLIGDQFPGHKENENSNTALEDSPLAGGAGFNHVNDDTHLSNDSGDESPRDVIAEKKMPIDRSAKYAILQGMSQDPSLSEGLDMHLSHALSPDRRTNRSFKLVSTAPEHDKLVAEQNARLVPKMNNGLVAWAKVMCIFGTNYVRPYCKEGVGITHFQSDYWTMPNFVRKYEKSGLLAGYTSQHMRKEQSSAVYLAPPWSLLELKIPFFQPNFNIEPNNYDGKLYSLFDDVHHRTPLESQDYGTSLLEYCYEPYCDFKESLASLLASRRNASRIDRFITTQLDNLDPVAAVNYINLLSQQMKSDMEYTESKHRKAGTRPLINNSIIPVQGGSKGGTTIDTQSTDPNIQYLEDIILHLKRMCSALGIDLSLLGWADTMSGGIGDGGFLQTSIQAARRATWIRQACETLINNAVELDFWYRYKKVLPAGQEKPWRVQFYSLNNAIEEQESIAREGKANFATTVATLVDTMMQGSSNGSDTLKRVLLSDVLDIDDGTLDTILKELNVTPAEGDDLMSEFNNFTETEKAQMILSKLMENAE